MISLNITDHQPRVFQCPNCKETIDTLSRQCRFCSAPIDPIAAQAAADAMAKENKAQSDASYRKSVFQDIIAALFG
jgi:predicted amidophosphoribosyltransferase